MIQQLTARTLGRIYDVYALALLDYGHETYMPWTSSAVRPGLLACMLNDILINERKSIVEFGCGISTLLLGRNLDPSNHRIISFEQDRAWSDMISAKIRESGMDEFCTVVHAPLMDCEYSLDGSKWYDTEIVRNTLSSRKIDIVLCDGPSTALEGSKMSRYPAVPVVSTFLADNYSIYLDDIQRPGERSIANRWGKELGIKFRRQILRGSFAVGTNGQNFNALI